VGGKLFLSCGILQSDMPLFACTRPSTKSDSPLLSVRDRNLTDDDAGFLIQ